MDWCANQQPPDPPPQALRLLDHDAGFDMPGATTRKADVLWAGNPHDGVANASAAYLLDHATIYGCGSSRLSRLFGWWWGRRCHPGRCRVRRGEVRRRPLHANNSLTTAWP